jgi:CxxC-x17-CxxC domain-containing protein
MPVKNDYYDAREEFEILLANVDSLESEWQRLFTKYPFILADCLALGIASDALIPCKPGRAEADFYFYPADCSATSHYGVIEIKRPSMRLLKTPRKDVLCLSADATAAVAQASKYAAVLGADVERTTTDLIVLGNRSHMFVIGGLSREIAEKVTNELLREQARGLLPTNCKLITFDALARDLKARTPPRLHVLTPWDYSEATDGDATVPIATNLTFLTPQQMHETTCTVCGHRTFVPFRPTAGKPILCRDCFRAKQDGNRGGYRTA